MTKQLELNWVSFASAGNRNEQNLLKKQLLPNQLVPTGVLYGEFGQRHSSVVDIGEPTADETDRAQLSPIGEHR